MENAMENEMVTLGHFRGVYRDITPITENQMENEMETGDNGKENGNGREYGDSVSLQLTPAQAPHSKPT